MSIVLDGTTGVTAPAFDGALDATDLTGDVAAARITTALNASGSAPIFACRAWVNFNGTGTVAIRASGNVSSITDNGAGEYTVNFATALPDVNYAAFGQLDVGPLVDYDIKIFPNTSTTALVTTSLSNAATDIAIIMISVFR